MVLLIDKPVGITSFDVIRKLRKELGIKKMGHAGTLDPLASGLLIVATEEDTKQLDQFLKLSKTYEVGIRLGESRTTGDLEGEIIKQVPVGEISSDEIQRALNDFIGAHTLPVPLYSAIKVEGKPLYWYARNNVDVVVPKKEMKVLAAEYLRMDKGDIFVSFSVSSGTYIRSLVEEFGRRLGYPAVTSFLRRTSIGEFSVEDARKV